MSNLYKIIEYNKHFVTNNQYTEYITNKYPAKNLAIIGCMDARMMELLPKALGLKNGDAKLITNAGAIVSHLWGSVIRSLIVAIYELNVKEIMVIGHLDCGMFKLNAKEMIKKMNIKGITNEKLNTLINAGIDIYSWLSGFDDIKKNVSNSVNLISKHPLIPDDILIHGLIIHPTTGKLEIVCDGNK